MARLFTRVLATNPAIHKQFPWEWTGAGVRGFCLFCGHRLQLLGVITDGKYGVAKRGSFDPSACRANDCLIGANAKRLRISPVKIDSLRAFD